MSNTTEPKSNGKIVAPYGTWKSPITADILTQKKVVFGEIAIISNNELVADIAFVENRPQEGGRAALVKKTIDLQKLQIKTGSNEEVDLTKGKHNVRSGVHEYGGGALKSSRQGAVVYTDYKSFDVFEVEGEGEPRKLTSENKLLRFGDFAPHPKEPLLVCVMEDHTHDTPEEVVNTLVSINKEDSTISTLVSGSDFYTNPRISPDGRFLAWVSWNHPSMPFFATELWVGELKAGKGEKMLEVSNAKLIGRSGVDEVSHHPVWADASTLLFSNDTTDFSNLYKVYIGDDVKLSQPQALCQKPIKSEFISPSWTLNNSSFVVMGQGWLACIPETDAIATLALLNLETGEYRKLKTPFVEIGQLRAIGNTGFVVFDGVQSKVPSAIVVMDLNDSMKGSSTTPLWSFVKQSSAALEDGVVPRDYLTEAQVIEFPTELPDGKQTSAHGVIYPPCNPKYTAPAGTSPPCIVKIHGGPTSLSSAGLVLALNYWTSRGFMVCMVNYGGSTGYGRKYMLRLEGQWGVVDVRDAVAAATYLGSPRTGQSQDESKARRRMTQRAQAEMARLKEKQLPSGAKEYTLLNPGSWSFGISDAAMAATLSAAGAFIPGLMFHHGLAAAGLAWLYKKMMHVQQETVMAIPSIGLQLTTTRGFVLPNPLGTKPQDQRFITTSRQTKLIPRDCILDLFTNEAFKRWGVVDYLAVATRPPPTSKSTSFSSFSSSRGNRLEVLFPNLLPSLPVVELIYRSIYPAIFGHEVPLKLSSNASSSSSSSLAAHDGKSQLPLADPDKIVISGGSAGGYTVLASLCLYPHAFSAGCSSYGVSDVTALDADCHKFESRYTERLMGGTPAQVPEIYRNRSPINMANRIKSPILLLQGDLDKVVPPDQSEEMYKTIQGVGTKAKYILFEGEGHGFRQAKNIKRALEEEEAWYLSCFNIDGATTK